MLSFYECLQNSKYKISVTSSIQIIFERTVPWYLPPDTITVPWYHFCTINIRHNSLPFNSTGASFFSSIPPTLSRCEPPLLCLLTLNHMLVNPWRFPPLIRLWDSSFPDISLTDSFGRDLHCPHGRSTSPQLLAFILMDETMVLQKR